MFADRQSGGGAYHTSIYLCDTTPSVGHASVDESLIALDFPHFLHLLYRGQRAPGGSSFIHLRELRSFPLFLPPHTLKSHLYWSIDSQRLYPQPLTPPPLLMVELRKAVPAQQIVLLFLFLYSFLHLPLISFLLQGYH